MLTLEVDEGVEDVVIFERRILGVDESEDNFGDLS